MLQLPLGRLGLLVQQGLPLVHPELLALLPVPLGLLERPLAHLVRQELWPLEAAVKFLQLIPVQVELQELPSWDHRLQALEEVRSLQWHQPWAERTQTQAQPERRVPQVLLARRELLPEEALPVSWQADQYGQFPLAWEAS